MKIERLNVLNINGRTSEKGQSVPINVLASDNRNYVMKKQSHGYPIENPDLYCSYFQEILSYGLAEKLDLTTPKIVVLNLSDNIVSKNRELLFKYKFFPGLKLGTSLINPISRKIKLLSNQYRISGNIKYLNQIKKLTSSITNKNDYFKLFVLDIFVGNFDRIGNLGNILIRNVNDDLNLIAIDFDYSFLGGVNYDIAKKQKLNYQYKDSKSVDKDNDKSVIDYCEHCANIYFDLINRNIEMQYALSGLLSISNNSNENNPFFNAINILQNLSAMDINMLFENIPKKWVVSDYEIQDYKNFLVIQQQILPRLVKTIYNKLLSIEVMTSNGKEKMWTWNTNQKNAGIQ